MTETTERRQHRRYPVRTTLHCRRIGRGGFDEDIVSADLSAGGCLVRADRRLGVGDVLVLDIDASGITVGLKGLVIAAREVPGHPDERLVHIAFTGLNPERFEALGQLLEMWASEAASSL